MHHSPFSASPAMAATFFITAAAFAAALAPPVWQSGDSSPAAPVLACALDGGSGAHIVVTNHGALPLQAQAAFSWSTLGTPAPRGGMQALVQDLAPGQSITLPVGAALHASGCVASLIAPR